MVGVHLGFPSEPPKKGLPTPKKNTDPNGTPAELSLLRCFSRVRLVARPPAAGNGRAGGRPADSGCRRKKTAT